MLNRSGWLRVRPRDIVRSLLRQCIAFCVLACSSWLAVAQPTGGEAPYAWCTVSAGNCTGQGAPYEGPTPPDFQQASNLFCARYAAAHVASPFSCPCGGVTCSTVSQCQVLSSEPAAGWVGASSGPIGQVFLSAVDTAGRGWSNTYTGPSCGCPAGATLRKDGKCGCPAGHVWDAQTQKCMALVDTVQTQSRPATACERDPLSCASRNRVATGIRLGATELTLAYDTTSRLPANQADTTTSLSLTQPRPFGPLWTSSFHRWLHVAPGQRGALVARGDGSILSFSGDGSGAFSPTADHANRLVSTPGGYRFSNLKTGDLETYSSSGALTSIAAADGTVLNFTYSGDNLVKVEDAAGRSVRFNHANGLVSQIIGPDGNATTVSYDAAANLTAVTWPDTRSAGFVYENAGVPWALTGKLDENGNRHATYTYDNQGRAVSVELAAGVGKVQVTHTTPPLRQITETRDLANSILYRVHTWTAASGTSVVGPAGHASLLTSQVVAGVPRLTAQTQPAGSGSAGGHSAMAYDSSGNVISRDDYQGMRSCYAYDSSNRETMRVEGLASTVACAAVLPVSAALPAGARRTATTWHPDWDLPTEVVEPLRRTTTIYNGQPDPFNGNATASCTSAGNRADGKPLPLVCKRVEQALLPAGAIDASIPASVTTHTYDAAGRLLTATDPNGHTSTRVYAGQDTFPAGDPSFASVRLLLHANGSDGSTTFTDSSPTPKSVVASADAKISTAQSRFGGASIAFDGSGDYLTVGVNTDWSWMHQPNAAWTFEGFFKLNSFSEESVLFTTSNGSTGDHGLYCAVLANTRKITLQMYRGGASTFVVSGNFATALPNDANWHHIAVVWDHSLPSNNAQLFIDGVLSGSLSKIGGPSTQAATAPLRIGTFGRLNGFADELRITQAVRYMGNFTPPTQEFPNQALVISPSDVGQAVGDLQTITNAVGQVTTNNLYDRMGRVRKMTDAKGVVTDIAYTPRGWVSTVTVTPPGGAARTTTYSYDFAGQLTGTTQPDGTTVSYSYDAAHRLTGATDSRGNSITYTLDNAGNRTGEEVRDPGGALQRSIARSFDALNRLQQVTGATN